MAVVHMKAAREYMKLSKKVGVTSATRLTYAKAMSTLPQIMKTRKKKMPSIPWDSAGFNDKY